MENPVFLEAAFLTTVFIRCVLLNIQNAAMHSRSRFYTFVHWSISLINKGRGVIRGHGRVVIMRNSQDWSCLNLETPEKGSEGVPPCGKNQQKNQQVMWLPFPLQVREVGPAVSLLRRTFTKLAGLAEAQLPKKKSSVEFSGFARKSILFCVDIIDFHVVFGCQRIHFSRSYEYSVKKYLKISFFITIW